MTGIILGSGLQELINELSSPEVLFEDKNSFHQRKILRGKFGNDEVFLFKGRKHFYEGAGYTEVVSNILNAKKNGIKNLIITNAAGGVNRTFRVTDLMLITSHIDIGFKRFGNNQKMTNIYDRNLNILARKTAIDNKIKLQQGVYCSLSGPCYETKSDIRTLMKIKTDAVGMSTVPEVLHSKENNIRFVGISCITNMLYESTGDILCHSEVEEAGKNTYEKFSKLIKVLVKALN
jgi:purine-nucleoside phosphorylase